MKLLGDQCPFRHQNIDQLVGVAPQPIEDLPTICTCGAPLTYAEDVVFLNLVTPEVLPGDPLPVALCPRCSAPTQPGALEEGDPEVICARCTWPNPSFVRLTTTLAKKEQTALGYSMSDQALEDFAARMKDETTLKDPKGRFVRAKVFEVHVHDGQVDVTFEFDPLGWQVPQ